MTYVKEIIEDLKERFPTEDLRCLEIGTICSYDEGHESTRHIGLTLILRGTLWSVDNSEKSITISKDISRGLTNITWFHQDSIDFLNECVANRRDHEALDFNDTRPPAGVGGATDQHRDPGVATAGNSFIKFTPSPAPKLKWHKLSYLTYQAHNAGLSF